MTDKYEKKLAAGREKIFERYGSAEKANSRLAKEVGAAEGSFVKQPFPFSITPASDDEKFMLEALKEAWKASQQGEVPVGAVLGLSRKSDCTGP